eukprot:GHVH01014297.1.p1 GENE.GHVH01014297.1~~GHVH01014297.1.p1  ORF type:complete len:520 (+),score=85.24 GHVH01014297.1:209-1768(+)
MESDFLQAIELFLKGDECRPAVLERQNDVMTNQQQHHCTTTIDADTIAYHEQRGHSPRGEAGISTSVVPANDHGPVLHYYSSREVEFHDEMISRDSRYQDRTSHVEPLEVRIEDDDEDDDEDEISIVRSDVSDDDEDAFMYDDDDEFVICGDAQNKIPAIKVNEGSPNHRSSDSDDLVKQQQMIMIQSGSQDMNINCNRNLANDEDLSPRPEPSTIHTTTRSSICNNDLGRSMKKEVAVTITDRHKKTFSSTSIGGPVDRMNLVVDNAIGCRLSTAGPMKRCGVQNPSDSRAMKKSIVRTTKRKVSASNEIKKNMSHTVSKGTIAGGVGHQSDLMIQLLEKAHYFCKEIKQESSLRTTSPAALAAADQRDRCTWMVIILKCFRNDRRAIEAHSPQEAMDMVFFSVQVDDSSCSPALQKDAVSILRTGLLAICALKRVELKTFLNISSLKFAVSSDWNYYRHLVQLYTELELSTDNSHECRLWMQILRDLKVPHVRASGSSVVCRPSFIAWVNRLDLLFS